MPFETLVARLLTEALSSIVNAARMTSRRRRAAVAISRAIRELLSQKPDMQLAESLVTEARELLTKPTSDLLKAEKMLQDVRAADEARAARKAAQRRTARKRVRKKTTRKTSRKKTGGRKAAKKKYTRKVKKK